MRVKAVQIAQELGISKATVSLALNGKPGVSEKTREKILEYKKYLEEGGQAPAAVKTDVRIVVLLVINGKNISYNSEIDLWTDVLAACEAEARKKGYTVSVMYADIRKEPIESFVQKYNSGQADGVILIATELEDDQIRKFERIRIPMVIYDNESPDAMHNCIAADNALGVRRAVEYLFANGCRNITYLANRETIYNFRKRRHAYCSVMLEHNLIPYQSIVEIGTTVNSVKEAMRSYLNTHNLPDAFLMENYQVSIGTMQVLKERGVKIPKDLQLVGIDAVPSFMTADCNMTAVSIPHAERAVLAMMMLERELTEPLNIKSRILIDCKLIMGESTL